ncbi:HD domain-containing phosphohydrolase [Roseateles violae]|uniref:HD domain-containing phosphohydrolase n=1 Tax=Roseateles violae TaxID=3058042 RepID=A0ABT8DYY5_9BURK|nr:HD domain-containing phosphohydrolase [Pelomonas sp. PFR6]MDN3922801.1 HD domain-containing phosphohydrolase [Pelomonas sp. PFR6]
MRKRNPQPRSIYLVLAVIMIGLVLTLYAALVGYNYYVSQRRLQAQANELFERVGREIALVIDAEMRPAGMAATLLAATPLLTGGDHGQRLGRLPLMAGVLRTNESLSAVYGGVANGSFALLRHLGTPELRARFDAPQSAAFLLQSVDRDGALPQGYFAYYDRELNLIERRERPDYRFDPRGRPWFTQAVAAGADAAPVQTAPYVFFTTGEIGLTLAHAGTTARTAAGVDLSLAALSRTLQRQRFTPSAELMIVGEDGAVLAYAGAGDTPRDGRRMALVDEIGSPALSQLWRRDRAGAADEAAEPIIVVGEREWVVRMQPLPQLTGTRVRLAIASPRDELQGDYLRARRDSAWISVALLLLILPPALWTARLVSRPLVRQAREAEAIRRFDFSGDQGSPPQRSGILEVDQLSEAMGGMKQSLQNFLDISRALSAEQDFDRLLDRILVETIAVTGAVGGALHLLSDDGRRLQPAAGRLRGEVLDITILPPWSLDEEGSPSAAVRALRQDGPVELELRRGGPTQGAIYARIFEALPVQRVRMLALPLKNRQNQAIGALSLGFADADALPAPLLALVEALSGSAAVAVDNQLLLRARKALLEAFIQLLAGAIDAKSAYTGAHCQRVPELTKMLAQAACDTQQGPFADFALSEDDWEALHIAAWLHDCGKVTTPEYVVDKATKLETIYDRIHEIRTRFEVLKRDAWIALLEENRGPAELQHLRERLAPQWAALDEEFAFVASCNEGGEFMASDKLARLREIGARSWQRTLDDRLGLSIEEKRRRALRPAPSLPVRETLLADKPEHLVERPPLQRMPSDNRWGFHLREPEYLYNRGELHNLSVARGTLTEEERYKINDHIVQTIKMLESLPFPRHLRHVPELAGGHHEKMDGSGYPRGRARTEMSVPARMMAIADVFEALTADDRPYKKGKTLSEALGIMARMAREQHIDAQLFELFLRSGVCRDYAQRFLAAEQIDAIEIEDYLR